MTSAAKQPLTFTPPGPGPWKLDAVHYPRPVTAYWEHMQPEASDLGFADMASYYGLPIETIRSAYVNGFAYTQMVPASAEVIAARELRAAEVLDGKLWRDEARQWEEVRKPASIRTHRDIQAIQPEQLSEADLVAYLRRCCVHHAAMIRQHKAHNGTASIPPGNFLAQVREWTGLPTVQLLGLMRGASPVSGGGSAEHAALVAAFRADASARSALNEREDVDGDGDAGALLERLRRRPDASGQALNDYLELVGHRLLDGFDISGRNALEMPDVLLRSIRTAIDDAGAEDIEAEIEAQVADVRAQVPEQHRDEYDALLAEARVGYRVRDERGVYSDIWASGLMRRGAMAAGRRLAARGRVHDAEHFVFADIDEMCAMVEGAPTPTADELAARFTFHMTYTAKDAPAHLGDAPAPPPDPASFPPAIGRLMAAQAVAMGEMFSVSEQEHEDTVIRGLPASSGVREGIARRVAGPADFDRIQHGDVLVTEATTEAFNILLPLLNAIVTDSGGALSHAAIVAREYGIPGVVGTRDATSLIADGTRVRVDGDAGEVIVLG